MIKDNFKEIEVKCAKDDSITLSKIISENEYTLFELSAPWNEACKNEFPHLKQCYSKYKELGLEFFRISMETRNDLDFVDCHNSDTGISIKCNNAFKKAIKLGYGSLGLPSRFLFNKKGNLIASGDELSGYKLNEFLQELVWNFESTILQLGK